MKKVEDDIPEVIFRKEEKKVGISEKRQWPQNHINLTTLPELKIPGKLRNVKKTKESVRGNEDNIDQIEELNFEVENKENPEPKDLEDFTHRGKTAPLINQKDGQSLIMEIAKTKRCRVSRML